MKKSTELYMDLEALKNEIKALQEQGKVEDAYAKLEEVKALKQEIEVQKEIEKEEIENFKGEQVMNTVEQANEIVAFNKAVLGKPLSEMENALVESTDANGGYLVPRDQKTQIEELKRNLISLKELCNVIPVGTMAGSMPLEVHADDTLTDFDECDEINQSQITFGQVTWKLKNKGDIIPISNVLLQDEKANLTDYIGKRFAKKAVRTENKDIITELAKATASEGADYTQIEKVLNVELDPAISANAVIITDQDGFAYLDSLEDGQGRRLLTNDLKDETVKRFKGRRIVVLPNESISKTATHEFFVGDMSQYLAFFDREVYEVASSKEAGFTKNTTYMRVIERYDVQVVDSNAMKYVKITIE